MKNKRKQPKTGERRILHSQWQCIFCGTIPIEELNKIFGIRTEKK